MTISWYRTSFGQEEIDGFAKSIRGEHISQGPVTEEFERKIAEKLNIPYVVATQSGSVALLMAMMAIGIKPGDEIIMPNRTWIATAHAPMILGAKAKLVDVVSDIPAINPDKIRKRITSKTKAIIPVHLNGRSSDMMAINQIAKEYGLKVVEDACQAFYSKNSRGYLGTQSDLGCFSLGVAKTISTGQGGLIATRNEELYEKLKLIRGHGTKSIINPVYNLVGCNFRFTDLLASVGIAQLSKLEEKVSNVKKIYKRYDEGIKDLKYIRVLPVKIESGEIPIFTEALCEDRKGLEKYLQSEDISTRPFLPNVERAHYIKSRGKFPNSDIFEKHGIFLPCGPAQPMENVERVIEALKNYKK